MRKKLYRFFIILPFIVLMFFMNCSQSATPPSYSDDTSGNEEAVFYFKLFLGSEVCRPKGEVDLGVFNLSSSNKFTFKIMNTSGKTVTFKSLPRIANNPNYYITIPDSTIVIAPYKSYSFIITVYSSNPGDNSADIIIDNAGIYGGDYKLHLKGICSAVKKPYMVVLDPLLNNFSDGHTYTFRSLYNGQTDTQNFIIKNKGTAPLIINPVSISGSGEFIITQPVSTQLDPNAETIFTVRFNGSSFVGTKSGTVTINSNNNSEDTVNPVFSNYTFSVSGKVIDEPEPDVSLTDSNGDEITNTINNNKVFEDTVVYTENTMTFNIKNTAEEEINPTGAADLKITSIYLLCGGTGSQTTTCYSGAFTLYEPQNTTVLPGNQEICAVKFSPVDQTSRSVKLVVETNDPDEDTISVNITGAGKPQAPILVLRNCTGDVCNDVTLPVNFSTDIWIDNTSGSVLTYRLFNDGTKDFNLAGITNSTSFKIEPVTLNGLNSIAVEEGKDVKITFKPVTMGIKNETLAIKGTDGYTYNITVQGKGLDAVPEIYDPSSPGSPITGYDFGEVNLNDTVTKTFTVKNNGNGSFTLLPGDAGITVTGDGIYDKSLDTSVIPANGSATLTVVYRQNGENAQNAVISINGDHGNSVSLNITGSCTEPEP